jgi:hypothetical protein
MKIIEIIFLTVILNILNIQNCFSISNAPGIEDLEEKILDLEKRVFFLEKKSYNDAKQKNELTENANQIGIEFNDGKEIINNDNNISDNPGSLNNNKIKKLDSFEMIDHSINYQDINLDSEEKTHLKNLYNKSIEEIRVQNYDKSYGFLNTILTSKIAESNNREIREIIANSHYLIGEIYFKKNDYQNASSHLLQSYDIFHSIDEKNTQGANSLFQLAKSLKAMNKIESSCNTLKKIKHEFTKLSENLENKIDIESTQIKCNLE